MENLATVKTKWFLDTAHSELLFKVKHLMISNVKGEFKSFSAEINGENFSTSPITASIETASVFTNNEDRDNHLKSKDFFDTETYKDITFNSTTSDKGSNGKYQLKGQLTIKGISKEVTLEVEFGGINKDPWGNEKAGFSFSGKINRKDWGLNWNAALEAGGLLISDEVQIIGEVQFIKK